MFKRLRYLYSLIIILPFINGCVPYFNQPLSEQRAELGAETPARKSLVNLPEPKEKMVAAVYKFRDQTGQYKPSATGANWSTAVTQGTTSILLKAIEESGWFIPIEREGLSNLLNERKIIRSSRANYAGQSEKSQLLPPLLFAGLVLEGGVISYDANVLTGGAGLKYFGAGASGQYRQDRVTVYLRAISTSNGRILKTVYTSKMILSQKLDASVFRYVKFKRLLEAEVGFTYNEPSEMAVKEAIEKAVESLIIEGVIEGLWDLKNPEDVNSDVVTAYVESKEDNQGSDFFDQLITPRRRNFGLGFNAGSWLYMGDYSHTEMEAAGGVSLLYDTQSALQFGLNFSRGDLATTESFQRTYNSLDVTAKYRLLPYKDWTPYIEGGLGVFSQQEKSAYTIDLSNSIYTQALYGAGVEFLFNDRLGLNLSIINHYIFNDKIDGLKQGNYNDYFWEGKIGLNFYFDKIWDTNKKKKNRKEKIRKKQKEKPKSTE
eukprot:TRINITY_DN107_c0_g4_i2.p1 TRINITY_DN107_c0_g4~~TRINITY_DN107_c0_g4_i2.p1  ORF type:complete len:488 (-),score=61.37 TRINITY_DN107_c0_g4_i2:61-1524(-)